MLQDGRQIPQPIRALPDAPDRGMASLIVNPASFAVQDALADPIAGQAQAHAPEIVVAVPKPGLRLAGVVPAAAVFAMLQGTRWQAVTAQTSLPVAAAFATPLLQCGADGRWRAPQV